MRVLLFTLLLFIVNEIEAQIKYRYENNNFQLKIMEARHTLDDKTYDNTPFLSSSASISFNYHVKDTIQFWTLIGLIDPILYKVDSVMVYNNSQSFHHAVDVVNGLEAIINYVRIGIEYFVNIEYPETKFAYSFRCVPICWEEDPEHVNN